jgi:osmotically-inducible protein OsmY
MTIKRPLMSRVTLSFVLFSGFLVAAPPHTDDYISDAVRQKLATDQVVKGGAIDVQVKEGVVTLKGRVTEPRQKAKAGRLAKKVKGVKQVVDELTVEKP